MQVGNLVLDRDLGIGRGTGLITRVDKDYYGNHIQGKKNRYLVMWSDVTGPNAWEYCKPDDIKVIQ
jgi:hypothetical protein